MSPLQHTLANLPTDNLTAHRLPVALGPLFVMLTSTISLFPCCLLHVLDHFFSDREVSLETGFIHTAPRTAMLWVGSGQWRYLSSPGFARKNYKGTLQLFITAKVTPLHQYNSYCLFISIQELIDTEEQVTNHCPLNDRWRSGAGWLPGGSITWSSSHLTCALLSELSADTAPAASKKW